MTVLATREIFDGLGPAEQQFLTDYAKAKFGGNIDAMLKRTRDTGATMNKLWADALAWQRRSQYEVDGFPDWNIRGVYDGAIGNPKYPKADRPKIKGGSPWQPQTPEQGVMWGSVADRKGQFYAPFTNTVGFDIYKKSHPKTKLAYTEEDLDGDQINEAVVRDDSGNLITVNGMGMKSANFGILKPYYQNRSQIRYDFEKAQGFRNADGNIVVAGIAKAFRENFLKDIYNTVLNPRKPGLSESNAEFIMSLRKAAPMGVCSKEFVHRFMSEQGMRAVVAHNVPEAEQADSLKRLLSTKKFKQYIARLLGSIPLSMANINLIKETIRVSIKNATRGDVDIANSPTWGDVPPHLIRAIQAQPPAPPQD
jgi:hypothetical protein